MNCSGCCVATRLPALVRSYRFSGSVLIVSEIRRVHAQTAEIVSTEWWFTLTPATVWLPISDAQASTSVRPKGFPSHESTAARIRPGFAEVSFIRSPGYSGSPRVRGLAAPSRSPRAPSGAPSRSEEHTSELQSRENLVCRLLLEKKKK